MKYVLAVSFILLLLTQGCMQTRTEQSKCEGIQELYQKYECYLSIVEDTRDSSVCRQFLFLPWKDECKKIAAGGQRISPECGQMIESDSKDICLTHKAEREGNPSLCGTIQNKRYKDDCYFSIAVSKRNPDSCKYMQHRDRTTWCYMELAHMVRDASICRGIENQDYDDLCYQTISEFNSDPSVCDSMAPGWGKDYCYEKSLYYVENRDVSICDKIGEKSVKEACVRIAGSNQKFHVNNDTAQCTGPDGTFYLGDTWVSEDGGNCSCTRFAGYCYGSVASISIVYPGPGQPGILVNTTPLKGDSPQSKCGSFSSQDYRDACYNMLAEEGKNSAICGFIEDPTSRDSCVKRLSYNLTEPSVVTVCDRMADQFERNLCYEELAKTDRDPSICEKKIAEKTSRDLCYSAVSKILDDSSLCGKIRQQIYRELCLSYFSRIGK